MKHNKGFAPVVILLIILVIIATAGGFYLVWKNSASQNEVVDNSNSYLSTQNQNNNDINPNTIVPDPTKATLIIKKNTVGGHTQNFDFLVKGVSSEPGVSNYSLNFTHNDDQKGKILQLNPGTYTISETLIPNWTTRWACIPGHEGGTDSNSGNSLTVDIGAGKSVTCTFFNRLLDTSLQEGSEIFMKGTYVKNTTDRELDPTLADGGSYQIINTEKYGQIKILVGGFRKACLAKETYQPSKGELVEVYGEILSNNTLSVCSSNKYFLTKKVE